MLQSGSKAMPNIAGLALGRQLRAARVLAGLEQAELARAARLHVNSVRRLERMAAIPASSWHATERIVRALGDHGVEVVATPTPSVRLF